MFPVENIRSLCKEQGITIAELERRTGIGNGVISKWENAPRSPQIDSLVLIAAELHCTVDDLLTGKKMLVTIDDERKTYENDTDAKRAEIIRGLFDLNDQRVSAVLSVVQSFLSNQ